jgi:tetratricopeptide (TPR) repeat protein
MWPHSFRTATSEISSSPSGRTCAAAGVVPQWPSIVWCRQRGTVAAPASPSTGHFTLGLGVALAFGPRPADEALATLDAALAAEPHAGGLLLRAVLLAMLGRIDEAWAVALPAGERLRELGLATAGAWLADVALLAGDGELAATYLRDACDRLGAIGNFGELSSYAPLLGRRVLCTLGRHDEAEPLAQRGRELGQDENVMTQQMCGGRHRRWCIPRAARTPWLRLSLLGDSPVRQAEAFCDLDEVLAAGGRNDEAADALEQALHRYERRRDLPDAARVLLEQLRPASRALEP